MKRIAILTTLLILAVPQAAFSQAQTIKLEINGSEDIAANLEKLDNKPVTVILNSDKELTGKVYNVTEKLLHLTDLQGKDYFDAIIKIDSIQAIIVKARG